MKSIRKNQAESAVHWIDTILVVINAIIITLFNMAVFKETSAVHEMLGQLISVVLYVFVLIEIIQVCLLKGDYFRDHRNIFVIAILIAAFALHIPELTILLLFNVLRTFRILDLFPKTRHVIDTLFHAFPGSVNLLFLILIAFFVFAVLATNLYGEKVPDLWGTIPQSMLSLQQIMLGDDWGNNLRATGKFYPYAWVFSTAFLIVVTFVLLNVFVGVIVDAMQTAEEGDDSDEKMQSLQQEIKSIKHDIALIKKAVTKD